MQNVASPEGRLGNKPGFLSLFLDSLLRSSGLIATTLAILLAQLLSLPNPLLICMACVVLSVFVGGAVYGAASALLVFLYGAWLHSGNLLASAVTLAAVAGVLVLAVLMKQRLAAQNRELSGLHNRVYELSIRDELTGLANRRHLDFVLDQEWKRAVRNHTPLSVALLDIDCFKRYNDSYGHLAGDQCLQRIALAIANQLHRPGDFAARFGGEEFLIIMPETHAEGALKVIEDLRLAVEFLDFAQAPGALHPTVTLSAGLVSRIPLAGDDVDDFVRQADIALYRAKEQGRNSVLVYQETEAVPASGDNYPEAKRLF